MNRQRWFKGWYAALLSAVLFSLLLAGCGGGGGQTGAPGPTGAQGTVPTNTVLNPNEDLPGALPTVTGVSGGTGPDVRSSKGIRPSQKKAFQAGDTLSVTFVLRKNNGTPLPLSELNSGGILVSGPSFRYQRVLAYQTDLLTRAAANGDGSYTYTFATPIPSTYLAPLNDSESFGVNDGELQGKPLIAGTYTVAILTAKNYTVKDKSYVDVGNGTLDFVVGGVAPLEPREVVKNDNCNRCHATLQAHGGTWRDVRTCLLCHTAGAEDKNDPAVEGGTPGVSIDFLVMIHKIHNGSHLPSVLGVASNPDGSRNYSATPAPYKIVGDNSAVFDMSKIGFPIMPSAYAAYLYDTAGTTYQGVAGNGPMPRDTGFSSLTAAQKLQEDKIRTGAVACARCHGDPDGSGPLTAPSQEYLADSQPTRRACGSCHDDINWSYPYTSNGQTMQAQANDLECVRCHTSSGTSLSVQDVHTHPWSNSTFNTGVNVNVTAVGGGSGAGGRHQAGDPITTTFSVTNDAGANLNINGLTRFQMIVVGPTSNTQLILPNINVFDFSFRKSKSFTGNGAISTPTVGSEAVQQTLALVCTATNTFDVIGSVSGTLKTGLAVPDGGGNTGSVTYAGVTFKITDGSTNFAEGDRWYFEVVPTAGTYTTYVPDDIVWERIGAATGGANVLSVANVPLYWGRQDVYERTTVSAGTALGASHLALGRYVVANAAALPAVAVGDKVVIANGTAAEEYLEVGRIQTTDDITGADLGTSDRFWFTTALRYDHAAGESIAEVTLTAKREGIAYTVSDASAGQITLVAGKFTAGNPVVVSYRTYGRFGKRRAPGDTRQDVFPAAAADTDDIAQSWGDWKGLSFVDGTYTVGMWANRDFTVTPLGALTTVESWNNFASNNTTYRMISPPATKQFLYGSATALTPRTIISSGDYCDTCHGTLQAHGFGRRGLDTCLLCHSIPGTEDGPKYSFSSWYIGPTQGQSVDYRSLLHKAHMGKNLANAGTYVVNGVFLGTPYPVSYEAVGFPAMPGKAKHCDTCHGTSTAWKEPADRSHPTQQGAPLRQWNAVCGSCHDSNAAQAHIALNTSAGTETCFVCHGQGREYDVEVMHKNR
ncbi:MAG: hypothetical protein HYU64_16570 [Armatimonadetes bacterium]|nr:hypothetical protein [Armatimonadota bacterium]